MTDMRVMAVVIVLASSFIGTAAAQDKPSVAKYVSDGYEILRIEMGNPFLQFILKKDKALVWCSVQVQTGETSSCRNIK